MGTAVPGGLERTTDMATDTPSDDAPLDDGTEQRDSGPAAEPGAGAHGTPSPSGAPRSVFRLRDLDRAQRWVAAALGLGLLLAPIVAVIHFIGDWTPAGDPALMAVRSLDVGTGRTPLIGQPSSSHMYSGESPAHHPGAVHFYLMAAPIRVLGGATGMLVVSALITGTALVASAWAVFRQLGRTAGVLATVLLAAIAFTTGAASLVNPVSSNIAGYPLLLSTVLLWCVACGDIKLLPLTAAAVSFTAEQHLSVGIAIAAVTAGGLALLAATAWRQRWRRQPATWRALRRNTLAAGVVSLVLWAPVLLQQVVGEVGNLSQIASFAREGNSDPIGAEKGVWQVVNTLAVPPLLGRTDVAGDTFITRPTPGQWVTAAAVLALVAWLGWRWRSSCPRRARLCAMAWLVALAGFLTGSSIPFGIEQLRLAFYHWAWPLLLLVGLALGLAAVDAVRRFVPAHRPSVRAAVAGAAVVAVVVPAAINPRLERDSNTVSEAHARIERGVVDDIVDQVLAHEGAVDGRTVLLARNEPLFAGMTQAIGFRLLEHGVDIRYPPLLRDAVHEGRLAERSGVDGGLLVVMDDDFTQPAPEAGQLVAEHAFADPPDEAEALDSLIAAAEAADEVRFGPEQERALDWRYSDDERRALDDLFDRMLDDPERGLRGWLTLRILRDHPPVEPAFDPDDVATVATSGKLDRLGVTAVRVYALDRGETLEVAHRSELR